MLDLQFRTTLCLHRMPGPSAEHLTGCESQSKPDQNPAHGCEQGIDSSAAVQEEDVTLCEAVQRGLASPAYNGGR